MSRTIEIPDDIPVVELGVFAYRSGCRMMLRKDGAVEFIPRVDITDRPAHFRKMVQKRREQR